MPSDARDHTDRVTYDNRERVDEAIKTAKAKDARLRLMKERNENYLAERKEDEAEVDE
jgi:hypothetical protein